MKSSSLYSSLFLATTVAVVPFAQASASLQKARPATPPVAAVAAARAATAPATLRFHYVAGQKLNYTTTSVQNQQLPGAAASRITTTAGVSIETKSVAPNGNAEQAMQVTSMNLAGPNIPPAASQQISAGLANMTLAYTQNPRGQIVARQPVQGVSAQLRPVLDAIMQSVDQMAPQLPENAVAVGATWSDHRTMHMALGPTSMDLAIDVTYTLRAVTPATNGGTAQLDMAMRMSFPNGVSIQGATLAGGGSATGSLTLDLGRGAILNSSSTGTMAMQVTAAGHPAIPINSTFTNTMALRP